MSACGLGAGCTLKGVCGPSQAEQKAGSCLPREGQEGTMSHGPWRAGAGPGTAPESTRPATSQGSGWPARPALSSSSLWAAPVHHTGSRQARVCACGLSRPLGGAPGLSSPLPPPSSLPRTFLGSCLRAGQGARHGGMRAPPTVSQMPGERGLLSTCPPSSEQGAPIWLLLALGLP